MGRNLEAKRVRMIPLFHDIENQDWAKVGGDNMVPAHKARLAKVQELIGLMRAIGLEVHRDMLTL
jgi:hypothetical protein